MLIYSNDFDFRTTEKRIVSSLIHEEKKTIMGMDRNIG